jgi:hypothetical protein
MGGFTPGQRGKPQPRDVSHRIEARAAQVKQSGHILGKKDISLKISITPSGEFHAANFKSQKSCG